MFEEDEKKHVNFIMEKMIVEKVSTIILSFFHRKLCGFKSGGFWYVTYRELFDQPCSDF